MIVFRCPRCDEQLSVPESLAGQAVSCPTCENVATTPAPHPTPGSYARGGPQPACSRLVYILLGLFLGGFGVHNFAAGYTGRGVAQLLITVLLFWLIVPLLVVAVWVIVELVTVTEDARGVAM